MNDPQLSTETTYMIGTPGSSRFYVLERYVIENDLIHEKFKEDTDTSTFRLVLRSDLGKEVLTFLKLTFPFVEIFEIDLRIYVGEDGKLKRIVRIVRDLDEQSGNPRTF